MYHLPVGFKEIEVSNFDSQHNETSLRLVLFVYLFVYFIVFYYGLEKNIQ